MSILYVLKHRKVEIAFIWKDSSAAIIALRNDDSMNEERRNIGLLVNNDPVDQALFAWAFNETCPDSLCCVASCEEEALNIVQVAGVDPDFIFIEQDLPGLDLERLLRRLREIDKLNGVPIMIHSRRKSFSLQRIDYAGPFAVYRKSLSFENVKAALHVYLVPKLGKICPN